MHHHNGLYCSVLCSQTDMLVIMTVHGTSASSSSTSLTPTVPSSSGNVGSSATHAGKGSVQRVGLTKVVFKL